MVAVCGLQQLALQRGYLWAWAELEVVACGEAGAMEGLEPLKGASMGWMVLAAA